MSVTHSSRRSKDAGDSFSMASRNSDRQRPFHFSLSRLFSNSHRSKSTKSLGTKSSHSHATSAQDKPDVGSENRLPLSVSAGENSLMPSPNIAQQFRPDSTEIECIICCSTSDVTSMVKMTLCGHEYCLVCVQHYLRIEIMESRTNISCLECAATMHPTDIQRFLRLEPELFQKYETFMLRRVLMQDPDVRWCPAPDCSYAVIATGCAGCPKLQCERYGCGTQFCYHCKQIWHPDQTCDAARAQRSPLDYRTRMSISYSLADSTNPGEIKSCPCCGTLIMKLNDGSCNHMTCIRCGAEFCWLCLKQISDLHYLSPSGCTFWGKKTWNKKKKVLWQLGTLIGAPVGITLIAGVAVPAMLVGIPVWVGRKMYSRYNHLSKSRRNVIVVSGVAASAVAAPVVAALTVGIGVPVLFAYVYGVVPVLLCRNGACGVKNTEGGSVRFDLERDTVPGFQPGHSAGAGDIASRIVNASIAPSIGEVSLGMLTNSLSASGTHIERAGTFMADRLSHVSDAESASHRAIAGASLVGSLCESSIGPPAYLYQHKLEVHAEISGHRRPSNSSESAANVSLGDKSSVHVLPQVDASGDGASTKALAGSILSHRDADSKSVRSDSASGKFHRFYSDDGGLSVSSLLVAEQSVEQHSNVPSTYSSTVHSSRPGVRRGSSVESERSKKSVCIQEQVHNIPNVAANNAISSRPQGKVGKYNKKSYRSHTLSRESSPPTVPVSATISQQTDLFRFRKSASPQVGSRQSLDSCQRATSQRNSERSTVDSSVQVVTFRDLKELRDKRTSSQDVSVATTAEGKETDLKSAVC